MTGKLIIARHHESEWNKLGKWTGTRDVHLTDYGFEKSEDMGLLIKDLTIDYAFASMQVRSIETLSCILNVCKRFEVPITHSANLNERDYGDYTGKNKWDMEKLLGEEEFKKLRRSWSYEIPNGESLKMVYDRVVPFFLDKILPEVKDGKNVLVVAHGNSLRALTKYIENISDTDIADVEVPFGSITIYDLDSSGHILSKEVRQTTEFSGEHKKAQIVATIGPASSRHPILRSMLKHGMDIARLNFSWGDLQTRVDTISIIRKNEEEFGRHIPIIIDLPGPRVQGDNGHTYDHGSLSAITEQDKEFIKFGVEHKVDYFAVSFVGGPEDVLECKKIIQSFSGTQKIIAKIERKAALESLEKIIAVSDAIMVARGDLGNEVPVEEIPFIQNNIIKKSKEAGRPVIVATEMLFSMVGRNKPTRAEVSDVDSAILEGADAVMLSEETAVGEYPVEAVSVMEKVILEAEKHLSDNTHLNLL